MRMEMSVVTPPDAERETIWFFDFDGTISEFVPSPDEAEIHPACRDLIRDLASRPFQRVAILSSRLLDDVVRRVHIPGVYLGGGSGMEWIRPGGGRFLADPAQVAPLKKNRQAILPSLRKLEQIPGVDVEDKRWSVAVHVQRASKAGKYLAEMYLGQLHRRRVLRFFRGRDAFEIPFLAGMNKAVGAKMFAGSFRCSRTACSMVYAGDDENDAMAMKWVVRKGGVAFAVGKKAIIPAARHVAGPGSLAAEIRRLFQINGYRGQAAIEARLGRAAFPSQG